MRMSKLTKEKGYNSNENTEATDCFKTSVDVSVYQIVRCQIP
jgi:hypothetical protein